MTNRNLRICGTMDFILTTFRSISGKAFHGARRRVEYLRNIGMDLEKRRAGIGYGGTFLEFKNITIKHANGCTTTIGRKCPADAKFAKVFAKDVNGRIKR